MKIFRMPHLHVQPRLTWHFSVKASAKDNPIIVLTHNFAGTEDNFGKHVSLLNDLSFDVVTFDLSWHKHGGAKIFKNFIRREWAAEISDALKEIIKERPVITFSFSGPSYCVIDAVSSIAQKNPDKIRAMIFDSGPFEHHIECVKNMFRLHFKVGNKWAGEIIAHILSLAWDPFNSQNTQKSFRKIFSKNPSLPLLSLQGALDEIVPMEYIQECFKKAHPKNYQEVIFEKGSHLTSLKEEPEKYKQTLQKFLFDLVWSGPLS